MDLDALNDFHLVATHGGFGRAARATGRPKATLSRRVAELEGRLKLRLFDRAGGSLRLTEEGRAFLANVQSPLHELAAVEDAILGSPDDVRGRLRVSVPLLIGGYAMGELAARFSRLHPGVRLEIAAEDRHVDLIQEGFDVVVRANPAPDEDLVGRCFAHDRLVAVAAPGLDRAVDRNQGDFEAAAVVRISGDDPAPWILRQGSDRWRLHPRVVMRLPTLAMRDAVVSGAGVALLPSFYVRADIAAGRLVSWGEVDARPIEHWVLHASARLPSRKVRAFVSFLVAAFAEEMPMRELPNTLIQEG